MTQLALRRTWPDDPRLDDDFIVVIAGQSKGLGRIMFEKSRHPGVWTWSVYGFNLPQTENMRGSCPTFDEAKRHTEVVVSRLLAANAPFMPEPPEWRPGTTYGSMNKGIV